MSELELELLERLERMERKMDILLKPTIADDEWIDEETAARSLGISPRTLRDNVKACRYQPAINFSTTNGRKFQYKASDIVFYKRNTSTEIAA